MAIERSDLNLHQILLELHKLADKDYLEGGKRFGIEARNGIGIRMPSIRLLARSIRKNHALALQLWETEIHEARILASLVDIPKEVSYDQIVFWTEDFYSWDLCDQVIGNLFVKTEFPLTMAIPLSERDEEFVKRAGFVMMAAMAVHRKELNDAAFFPFLDQIERKSDDPRNFVKKAVNWALRQIGKRNSILKNAAVETAERILLQENPSARWIARDALRELQKGN